MDKRRNGFALLRSCFFDSADIVRAGFERDLRGSWVCGSLWHGSVDGDGFEVLKHHMELHWVLRGGFRSNIVHGLLKVVRVSDDLTFLVRDGEVNVLHHAAKV